MPHRYVYTIGRFSLFLIYVWFGVLKLIGQSPANPLVANLLQKTLPPSITFSQFILFLGIFEIIIGVLFIMPRWYKIAFFLFFIHFLMTTAPLIFIPKMVWTSLLVPTLEGQYIIKNIALFAVALFLYSGRR